MEEENEGLKFPQHPHNKFKFDPQNPHSWEFHFGSSEENAEIKKLILICVHGNEQCGMRAFNQMLEDGWVHKINSSLKEKKQRIRVILCNPKGVIENKRFIDLNLNRIFRSPFLEESYDMFGKPPYELMRLRYIADAIQWCDYLIDIHSTSAETPPFALCTDNPRSEKYASTFPVEYVIKDLSQLVNGTTLECAKARSKIGVSVECGQHESPHSIEIAMDVIKKFVTDVGEPSHNVVLCERSQMVKKGFHYVKQVKAFQKVEYKEVIAKDDSGPISCPFTEGAIVIMPTSKPVIGEEAWFWGEPSKSKGKAVQHQRE